MQDYYIGVMTGTSCDAVDASLINFAGKYPVQIHAVRQPISHELRHTILELMHAKTVDVDTLYTTDVELGHLFADTVLHLLNTLPTTHQKAKEHIMAVGCHGQTIRHRPNRANPYTVQIGDPNIIAAKTGITTVADFRRKDIAQGGQGAPLVPAFHQYVFAHPTHLRLIVNIGGMSNLTVLAPSTWQRDTRGFDTGPGNVLIDYYIQKTLNLAYDHRGGRARAGVVIPELLENALADPYFKSAPPKSTGRELFNAHWLEHFIKDKQYLPENVLCTLVEITAQSIALAVQDELKLLENQHGQHLTSTLYVCGGGAKNDYLLERIKALTNLPVTDTADLGVPSEWVETTAFAWLAKQALLLNALDLRSITGTQTLNRLGGIYYP